MKLGAPTALYSEGMGVERAMRAVAAKSEVIDKFARTAARQWRLTPFGRRALRRSIASSYFERTGQLISDWVPKRTETANFYYELSPRNRAYLADFVAGLTGTSPLTIDGYLSELDSDSVLRMHIEGRLKMDPELSELTVGYGRREGWYALIRATKPRLVVETGVHHGVGACLISAALARNADEGHEGRYLGTELDPTCVILYEEPYSHVGQVVIGDSLETLRDLDETVDIFINDSDHSPVYEEREYRMIAPKLSENAIVLGDNSHISSSLHEWSRSSGRNFWFFREEPRDHWYPGAGIGVSTRVSSHDARHTPDFWDWDDSSPRSPGTSS